MQGSGTQTPESKVDSKRVQRSVKPQLSYLKLCHFQLAFLISVLQFHLVHGDNEKTFHVLAMDFIK